VFGKIQLEWLYSDVDHCEYFLNIISVSAGLKTHISNIKKTTGETGRNA
jgi:hypothetical protein